MEMSVKGLEEIENHLGNKALAFLQQMRRNPCLAENYKGNWISFSEEISSKCIVLDKSSDSFEVMEFHKEFVDIHITLLGKDVMFIGEDVSEIVGDFNTVDDFGLVKVNTIKEHILLPGSLMLIKPNTYHINVLESGSVKLVFKIKY